jgi:hypothetical protein
MVIKNNGSKTIVLVTSHAKKIYNKGKEKWTDALKRATIDLKKKGII